MKTLFLIINLLNVHNKIWAVGFDPCPDMGPGNYTLTGKLTHFNHRFLLIQNQGSRAPLEFLLVGMPLPESLEKVGTKVSLSAKLKQNLNCNDGPALEFLSWMP